MHSEGHFGAAMLAVLPLTVPLVFLEMWILILFIYSGVIFGAMLPDIDMKEPWRYFLSHRKETHTIYFAILISFIYSIIFVIPEHYIQLFTINSIIIIGIIGFLTGFIIIMSHILTDMLTPAGVKLFRPFGKKRSFNLFLAKNKKWNLIFLFAGIISLIAQIVLAYHIIF